MPAPWRVWFSLDYPIDRRTYAVHGLGLMALKYAVDAGLIWHYTGIFWSPFDYLDPLWTSRAEILRNAPSWLGPAMVVFTLPFLWIGVTMTMRRAVNAGLSAWHCLWFFVPVVNYLWMAALCLLPPRTPRHWAKTEPAARVDDALRSALLGVGAAVAIAVPTIIIAVYLKRVYSAGLFLGTPFTIGYISGYVFNQRFARTVGQTVQVAVTAVAVTGGALILFALEGAICIIMAVPLAAALGVPGALLGRMIAIRSGEPPAHAGYAALLAPLLVLALPRQAPLPREVLTVVEIDAPPAVVWRYVVTFPELPPPTEWLFRAGVAAPVRAHIDGSGVGATRYCDFTTGSFVEPVTAWEEGRLLAFDITAQAPPMREWSPYRTVNPPHLDGYFRATHGEFRLAPLPGGRTRLEGRTTYVVDMFPQDYWTLPAGFLVEAIHGRVLRHIKALAEEEHR